MLTVSVMGSCRVFRPFNHVRAAGAAKSGHGRALWFTHSAPEVVQKYHIMRGELEVPPHVEPLISAGGYRFDPSIIRPDYYDGSDVFVAEIASIKVYELDGFSLQQWAVRAALRNRDAEPEVAAAADRATLHVQTKDDVTQWLGQIVDLVGCSVVFVPPVRVIRDDGTSIPEREVLREAMADFCAVGAARMYDPSELVYANGYDTAMKDSSHFEPSFEPAVGRDLLAFISA